MDRYEVQTCLGDKWENVWTEEGNDGTERLMTFDTHDDALAAIYEFFADLARAKMAQMYLLEDYRVEVVNPDAV